MISRLSNNIKPPAIDYIVFDLARSPTSLEAAIILVLAVYWSLRSIIHSGD